MKALSIKLAVGTLSISLGISLPTLAAETTHQHQLDGASAIADPDTKGFAAMMDEAMAKMHASMTTAKPSGDPDRDFAAMMIPHHQGAIDMAEIQLRFGRDERLRRLAQGIIVEQRQEIAVMQAIVNESPHSTPHSSIPALDHEHKDNHK